MSEAASDLSIDSESRGEAPTLHLVSGTADTEPSISPIERSVGRSAAVGAVLGFVITTVVVMVAGAIGGIGIGASIGLAVFIGMWSGVGAGFMFGATIPFARHFDAVQAATTPTHTTSERTTG